MEIGGKEKKNRKKKCECMHQVGDG